MAKTVTALYNNFETAQDAVQGLVDAGFQSNSFSIVGRDAALMDEDAVKGGEGAAFGMVVGALVGAGALLIPGIGPVIAAGPLAAALIGGGVGAVAGAVTGGLTASLVKTGINPTSAEYYTEGVRQGGTLVVVHTTDAMGNYASDVLRKYSPVNVEIQTDEARASDWSNANNVVTDEPLDEHLANDIYGDRRYNVDTPNTDMSYADSTDKPLKNSQTDAVDEYVDGVRRFPNE